MALLSAMTVQHGGLGEFPAGRCPARHAWGSPPGFRANEVTGSGIAGGHINFFLLASVAVNTPCFACCTACCACCAAFYEAKAAALGQDPLREDADPETAWARISASKKPIG